MLYIYIIFLLLLICWLIPRISFFYKSGLGTNLLVSLFLVRIIAAIAGYYFSVYYYRQSDSLLFHNFSIQEYNLIFTDLPDYFTNLFTTGYDKGYGGFFDTSQSYWNNLGSNLIIKLLSLFNLVSFKSFLINTLLFNFLVFFAPVALYKVFISLFPDSRKALIICIFLLPSALFFTSIIHKDALIFLSLSMVIYHIFFWLKNKAQWYRLFIAGLFIMLLVSMRGYVLIVLLPALFAWLLSSLKPVKSFIIFSVLYLLFTMLFFASPYITPKINFPESVSNRQAAFLEISGTGKSTIPVKILYPNLNSFLNNTPQALNHSFLRPYLFEGNNPLYLPFALEAMGAATLMLIGIFFRKKNIEVPPLIYFLLFFSITMLLVIGYTIPIIGAIVRYRSIYFIFLLLPFLVFTDWKKVQTFFGIKFLLRQRRFQDTD